MEYTIPCRGKRRRISCSDNCAKEESNPTDPPINHDKHHSSKEGWAGSFCSTAATGSDKENEKEEEDPLAEEQNQLQNDIILKKLQRVNGEGDGDQLLHTSPRAKLFEYVKGNDGDDKEGSWKCRGEGQVKFIRCLEEGYSRGMIRMELTKNFTLEILMCHEVTHEDAIPINSRKGKAYSWICKDWAHKTSKKTFAIRFDDSMQALEWKQMFEQSKINNCNVRRGIGVPDESAVDNVCFTFKNLSTVSSPIK